MDNISGHCIDLLEEAKSRNFEPELIWGERDLFAEIDIMTERERLVADCAASLLLSERADAAGLLPYCRDLISASFGPASIWGHGAVPAAIVRAWAMRRVDATLAPEIVLYSLLRGLLHAARDKRGRASGLPAPYYDFEECYYLHSDGMLGRETDISKDNMRKRAWFTRALLYMLAKRNFKSTCKSTWYEYSKVMHEDPNYPPNDFFDAELSKEGSTATHQFYNADWVDLVTKAVQIGTNSFLEPHSRYAWLIAAYISIVPYRAWDSVLLWLDSELNETWYAAGRLPS